MIIINSAIFRCTPARTDAIPTFTRVSFRVRWLRFQSDDSISRGIIDEIIQRILTRFEQFSGDVIAQFALYPRV